MNKNTIELKSNKYVKPQILLTLCEEDVLLLSGVVDDELENDNDGIDKELGW